MVIEGHSVDSRRNTSNTDFARDDRIGTFLQMGDFLEQSFGLDLQPASTLAKWLVLKGGRCQQIDRVLGMHNIRAARGKKRKVDPAAPSLGAEIEW